MKYLVCFISILLSACQFQQSKSINFNGEYKRIYKNESWGFLNQKGDTLIPLNKYEFLNPIDEQGMILAHNANKYGYINIHQDTLIEFIYDDLSVFSNGLAPAKLNGKYGYINRKGDLVIPFNYENENHFYECGLAKAQLNGKSGFIDRKGKEIVPIKFDKVRYNQVDKYVCVWNNKWAFYSCGGEALTGFEFDAIKEGKHSDRHYTYFKNGPCLVSKDGDYGFINEKFEVTIPFGKYDKPSPFDISERALIETDKGFGLINTNDQFMLEPKYQSIEYFPYPSGRYKVAIGENFGIVDSLGSEILPIAYKSITPNYFKMGSITKRTLILQHRSGKFSVTDYDGTILIPAEYDMIEKFEVKDDYSYAIAMKKGKYGIIDYNGRPVLPFEYDSIKYERWFDYLIIAKDNQFGLFTKNGKEIIPIFYDYFDPCYYDENNKFIVGLDGKLGIININQEIVIPLEFDEISNWVEYGPKAHFVVKNGKHGLIDRQGVTVVPPIYENIKVDNSILIKVKKNGLFGTVNWKNEIVHPIKYDAIYWEWPYVTGKELDTIFLKESGKYFATDLLGNVVDNKVPEDVIKKRFEYLIPEN